MPVPSNLNFTTPVGQALKVGFTGAPVGISLASFIGSPLSGTVPFTVTFTNQSTGIQTGWLWDFGDGSTSTSQNPTHAYTVAGNYTVTLQVTSPLKSEIFSRAGYVSAVSGGVAPTTATLSIPSSATVGVALSGTVTLNAPADQTYIFTLAAPGGTLSAPAVTINVGQQSVGFTVLQASAGSVVVDFTITTGPALTRAGRPMTVTAAAPSSATPFRNARTNTQYPTLSAALAGSISGDTIKLAGGNYTNGGDAGGPFPGSIYLGTNRHIELETLTLEWETPGDPMIIDNSANAAASYGVGVGMGANCRNLTIRGLWIKGYRDYNYASNCGVYCLAGYGQGYPLSGPYPNNFGFFGPVSTLTVEYCKFWQHTNGILTNHNHNLTLNIRYTTFEDCTGGATGLTHGIYTGQIAALNVLGSTFTTTAAAVGQSGAGHLLKSRAAITNIQGSLFNPAYGCARSMDISNGGQCSITGNVILHYGAVLTNDDNQVIAYGSEQNSGYATTNYAYDGRTHSLLIAQNTIRKRQPAQSYEIAVLWDAAITTDVGGATTHTTTVQNNIVAHDMPAAAAAFGAAYPNNSVVAYGTISDAGVYSGGVIAGSPAVNQAAYSYAGMNTVPTARTDTNRGGLRAADPAWLAGKPVNEWFAISGTSGAGGAEANAYVGWAITDTARAVIAAGAGHGQGYDNRVVMLNLLADAPTWQVLKASSSSGAFVADAAYYTDGKPAARHSYHSTFVLPGTDKIMLSGTRFTYPGAGTFNAVDAFDISNAAWDGVVPDAPGTSGSGYASVSPSGYYASAQDGAGDLWSFLHTTGQAAKYTVATNTWSTPTITGTVSPNVRYPWAWDSMRGQLFGLAWGDGEGFNTGLRAVRQLGTTQTAITFDSGSASTVALFSAEAPQYAGMCYDPVNDRFLFRGGSSPARIYQITPNTSSVWSMSLASFGAGSVTLPDTGAPICSKWTYVPALGGIVAMPEKTQPVYFLKVA